MLGIARLYSRNKLMAMAKSGNPSDCDYIVNNLAAIIAKFSNYFRDKIVFPSQMRGPKHTNALLNVIMGNPIAAEKMQETHPDLFDLLEKFPLYRAK